MGTEFQYFQQVTALFQKQNEARSLDIKSGK